MNHSNPEQYPEQNENLWVLVLPLILWAAHFLLSYITAAIWCAKSSGSSQTLAPVRVAIGIYTFLALVGLAISGWNGHRRVNFPKANLPHDDDTPLDRHRFLGFTLLLLSVLSAVATLFVATVLLFMETCD